MKALRSPINAEENAYMAQRQLQNHKRSASNKAENWMFKHLQETGLKWTRQSRRGYRIFDFWNHNKGIAVEVDGPEHNAAIDALRDIYNLARSGIVVVRVRNFNEADATTALETIALECSWQERRIALGLVGDSKKLARVRRAWEAGVLDIAL
jgi:very-short-patch-repair endonuclease